MSLRLIHALVRALVLSACAAEIVSGQASRERRSPKLGNECRLAAHVLEQGHRAPGWQLAMEQISRCDDTGGAVLAAVWASPGTDSAALERLYEASGRLRDGRLADAMVASARSTAAPRAVRMTALRALGEYLNPYVVVPLAYLMTNPDSGHVVERGHSPQHEGKVPVDTTRLAAIKALVTSLAVTDPDPEIRFAARYLKANVVP